MRGKLNVRKPFEKGASRRAAACRKTLFFSS
jgi:hypothetical protein